MKYRKIAYHLTLAATTGLIVASFLWLNTSSSVAQNWCRDSQQQLYRCYGRSGYQLLILSPDGSVSSERPTLSWTEITAAQQYVISIFESGKMEPFGIHTLLAEAVVSSEQGEIMLDYPFELPLQPGQEYKLQIEAQGQDHLLAEPLVSDAIFEVLADE